MNFVLNEYMIITFIFGKIRHKKNPLGKAGLTNIVENYK